MSMSNEFGKMLKLWRQRLGLSQLDLSVASGMSTKHISFLETGRSQPSKEAVVKLATALSLSNNDTQLLIDHAGYTGQLDTDAPPSRVEMALLTMLEKQEPYPGAISDYTLTPKYLNNASLKMLDWFEIDISEFSSIVELIFSEQGFRPYITNWEEMSRIALRLTKMKKLAMADNEIFQQNLDKVLKMPEVKKMWQEDEGFVGNTEPIVPVSVSAKGIDMQWIVVLSTFGTPRNVSLDEYQMEFFYPADEATKQFAEDFLTVKT